MDGERNSSYRILEITDVLSGLRVKWWLIPACAAVALVVALALVLQSKPAYEAVAGVAIVQSETGMTLDPKYRTLSESGLAMAGAQQAMDRKSRSETLASLVESGTVADEVISKLANQLDPEERNTANLLEHVQGSLRRGSDLIEIRVQASSAENAVLVANTWGSVYEKKINQLYAGPAEVSSSLDEQEAAARKQYDNSEAELVAYLHGNNIDYLQKRAEAKRAELSSLYSGILAQTVPFSSTVSAATFELKDLHEARRKATKLLGDATALRDQVTKAGANSQSSAALAITLLKSQAFASSVDLPGNLQISVNGSGATSGGSAETVNDLDALISVLQARVVDLDSRIEALSNRLERADLKVNLLPQSALSDSMSRLASEISSLEAQIEQQNAKRIDLTKARDTAKLAFETVLSKVQETRLSALVIGTQVRFASPASLPAGPMATGKTRIILLAVLIGLLVGVLAALVAGRLSRTQEAREPVEVAR